jgi:hypothetical protein
MIHLNQTRRGSQRYRRIGGAGSVGSIGSEDVAEQPVEDDEDEDRAEATSS